MAKIIWDHSKRMRFSLIVLCYNSMGFVREALESIAAQAGDFEIILADNGSSDGDYAALSQEFGAIYRQNGANLGYAMGNNEAAKIAKGDWLCFINPDVRLSPNWLDVIAQYTHRADILTGLQLKPSGACDGAGDALSLWGFPFRMGYGQPVPDNLKAAFVFAPCGAAFAIKKSVFEALGGFEEDFFCYCEDMDLGGRAIWHGYETLFLPEAKAVHLGSATLGERSDFALYHGYRNRFWLFLRLYPWLALWLLLPVHLALTLLVATKDILAGKAKIVASALWASLRGAPKQWRKRKAIQGKLRINPLPFLKSLTWNPAVFFSRKIDHRAVPDLNESDRRSKS